MSRTILLIDSHSLIHRCFHAVPPLTNPAGEPVGALYGVAGVLLKLALQRKPDYIAALFDRPEKTFRKEKFSDYKIHRPAASDELVSQLIEAHNLFKAFSIPCFDAPGYEGDDCIGTLVHTFKTEPNLTIIILTGDLDSLQLVEDSVFVETFKKGIGETMIYDAAAVVERYGITPAQMIDYKALVGDASDNIPGVMGIGPKTASQILQKYSTLDNFFASGMSESSYEKINSQKDTALLSRELATISHTAPIKTTLEECAFHPNLSLIEKYFTEQNFTSLIKRIPSRQSELNLSSDTHDSTNISKKIEHETETLSPILSDTYLLGYDLKSYAKENSLPKDYDDVYIAAQLLGISSKTWQELSLKILKTDQIPFHEFLTKSRDWLLTHIKSDNLTHIYRDVELPLIPILASMEKRGIHIDTNHLSTVEKDLSQEISVLEEKIHTQTNPDININSPKQLLSFITEHYPVKIKSTASDVLESIIDKVPFVSDLLAYRELFKLQSTYVQALQVIAQNNIVHPTFLQLGAATGRLSCQNPNLQNIPEKSSWSKTIRDSFVSAPGTSLVSCDYSQIELRVLASLSNDEHMKEAFCADKDIHTLTASMVFGVPLESVDKTMRRTAKTLNFGIVYGMGARAFAQQSGLPTAEAKKFIEKYFDEFSSIKKWQETIIRDAKISGRVTNINGRYRAIPALTSSLPYIVSGAEREAINMPIQSVAADILKYAMIHVNTYIQNSPHKDKISMVLTIHDELIFEIDDSLLTDGIHSSCVKDIQNIMESSFKLSVPIKTDVAIGKTWGEL